jgi:hypothetical protein
MASGKQRGWSGALLALAAAQALAADPTILNKEMGVDPSNAMAAVQAEYRFPLIGRFGGVVFAGTGKVARSFGAMGDERYRTRA